MKRFLLIALLTLPSCRDETAQVPVPVRMTDAAIGHYCQMDLREHPGPKAQVHLTGIAAPLFFAQVRDALAFQRMPEQNAPIAAIYVSDMGRAISWEDPGEENWIPASEAWFVVGSDTAGGMGADETVPFAARDDAQEFANRHGGQVQRLTQIADDAVLAPADTSPLRDTDSPEPPDYQDRLKALTQKDNT